MAHETRDRIITGLVTLVPFLMLGFVAWQVWDEALHWRDLLIFLLLYVPTGLGITVGFHRYLTHRSFRTSRQLRALLAIFGSAAIEGPVISWVADHRKHHAFSDDEGDPHSPHHGYGGGLRGSLRGLYHAHVGWLFVHTQRGSKKRFAPDLLRDPVISFVDRTFLLWAVVGLLIPFSRLGDRRHADRGPHRPALGRHGAGLRPASRHLQHQLALPRLRAPALRDR